MSDKELMEGLIIIVFIFSMVYMLSQPTNIEVCGKGNIRGLNITQFVNNQSSINGDVYGDACIKITAPTYSMLRIYLGEL